MATTKRHIAVYLAPAVEQALKEFCEQRGLKSKNGVVFSAGVNTVLAEFFGISDTEEDNTPSKTSSIPTQSSGSIPTQSSGSIPTQSSGSIPTESSNIPTQSSGSIPTESSNIPSESLAMEVLPGKLQA